MIKQEAVQRASYSHLMIIGENTARAVSNGKYLPLEYKDIVSPKPKDNRSGDEIARDIAEKAGLNIV